jgi:HPt (histidine-containing phosphotransfer) domain-containing protein
MESSDCENYAILAHAMKSDSKYLGFKKLAELSLNHELKGKENDISYIKDNYEELMNEVDRITNILEKYTGGC